MKIKKTENPKQMDIKTFASRFWEILPTESPQTIRLKGSNDLEEILRALEEYVEFTYNPNNFEDDEETEKEKDYEEVKWPGDFKERHKQEGERK